VNETIWKYKYMLCNPRYGAFAFLTIPYYLLYEVLGVFVEIASIGFVAWGWIAGFLDVKIFLLFLCLMIFAQTFISVLSLFSFLRSQRIFKPKYVLYLILLSFCEFLWYKWLITISKLIGTFEYFRGNRVYDQYIREKRVKANTEEKK
jgi:hypothetical protein